MSVAQKARGRRGLYSRAKALLLDVSGVHDTRVL